MKTDRQIYLLDPRELRPEMIAVTFAKTSRSPQSFRDIAADLSDESSAEFNEKWVVGYGHSSVAEHAVLHIAIENVSRLAVETIESNRLASYSEKSTRYQKWDASAFFTPGELSNSTLLAEYQSVCGELFSTYLKGLALVKELLARECPRMEVESVSAWDRRVRTQYIDVCRFLLPACSLANLGMTVNARALEHSLQKMLSSLLQEVKEIGEEIKRVSQAEIPTLVRYADRQPYLEQSREALTMLAKNIPVEKPGSSWCKLVAWDPDGEQKVLAAALYRFGKADYTTGLTYIQNLDQAERLKISEALLGNLGLHDLPLRELEHIYYTFDVIMDQGAFFEVKRHRMMTQTVQNLTGDLGYAIPRRIVASGFENEYRKTMDSAYELYKKFEQAAPNIAGYVIPNGFNRRVLLTMNLREAYHFCNLRSTTNAHFSVRRVAMRIAEEIRSRHPILAAAMQLPKDETWQSITEENFYSV